MIDFIQWFVSWAFIPNGMDMGTITWLTTMFFIGRHVGEKDERAFSDYRKLEEN